jgi:hypothetical protein
LFLDARSAALSGFGNQMREFGCVFVPLVLVHGGFHGSIRKHALQRIIKLQSPGRPAPTLLWKIDDKTV